MADPPPGSEIVVYSTKYDGSFHRRQPGWFLQRKGPLILIQHRAGIPIEFAAREWIPKANAIAHYWIDRWYSIYRSVSENGEPLGWYCNIATPAQFDGRTLRYMDLDIDISVRADRSYRILDEDEFQANIQRLAYPPDLIANVRAAVAEILRLVQEEAFPFDTEGPPLSGGEGRGEGADVR